MRKGPPVKKDYKKRRPKTGAALDAVVEAVTKAYPPKVLADYLNSPSPLHKYMETWKSQKELVALRDLVDKALTEANRVLVVHGRRFPRFYEVHRALVVLQQRLDRQQSLLEVEPSWFGRKQ